MRRTLGFASGAMVPIDFSINDEDGMKSEFEASFDSTHYSASMLQQAMNCSERAIDSLVKGRRGSFNLF